MEHRGQLARIHVQLVQLHFNREMYVQKRYGRIHLPNKNNTPSVFIYLFCCHVVFSLYVFFSLYTHHSTYSVFGWNALINITTSSVLFFCCCLNTGSNSEAHNTRLIILFICFSGAAMEPPSAAVVQAKCDTFLMLLCVF